MKKNVIYSVVILGIIVVFSLNSCSRGDDPVKTPPSCDDFTVEISELDSMLIATAVNGTDPITYLWSTGEIGSAIYPSITGVYSVTVTDTDGCEAENSFDLVFLCDFGINVIIKEETSVGNYELTPELNNGTEPFSYQWSSGQTTSSIAVTAEVDAVTYTVTVTDALGCNAGDAATIPGYCTNFSTSIYLIQDSITIGDIYLNAWVGGGTSPYTWNWSTGETTNEIIPNGLGNYSVTVTDVNGCEVYDSYELTVVCTLDVTGINIDETSPGNYDLTPEVNNGTSPYSYNWWSGETSSTISVMASAGESSYYVTVTDADGCTDNANVTIPGTDSCFNFVTEIFLVQDSIVIGDNYLYSGTSGGTPPYTWEWSTNENTEFIQVSSSGTYSVTATDMDGCATFDSYDY